MPGSRRLPSATDLQARLEAERAGVPFVYYEDNVGQQRVMSLLAEVDQIPIGRVVDHGLRLDWAPEVSRMHAVLQRVGGVWTVLDDMSRNGTFVNGERLIGRRPLRDRDVITCGPVGITFRDPRAAVATDTVKTSGDPPARRLTAAQRRVLAELCRPMLDQPGALPATNKEIADALVISVDAVKTHLRRLAGLFEVSSLPQNQQRISLAGAAIRTGTITARDVAAGELNQRRTRESNQPRQP